MPGSVFPFVYARASACYDRCMASETFAGLDTPYTMVKKGPQLVQAGYSCIGRYISPSTKNFPTKCCGAEEGMALHAAGLNIFLAWEMMGDNIDYFTNENGFNDASQASTNAYWAKCPTSVPIFFAVDFDATQDQIDAGIKAYAVAFHDRLKQLTGGRLTGVYGSGLVIKNLIDAGYAHYGWLAQSTGWAGYQDGKAMAAIIQGPSKKIVGQDCDVDTIVDTTVLWVP